jgi:hypothetical protein
MQHFSDNNCSGYNSKKYVPVTFSNHQVFAPILFAAVSTVFLSVLNGIWLDIFGYLLVASFLILGFVWSLDKVTVLIIFLAPNYRLFTLTDSDLSLLNILMISHLLSNCIFRPGQYKLLLNSQSYVTISMLILVYMVQYVLRYGSFLELAFSVKFILLTAFASLMLVKMFKNPINFERVAYIYSFGAIFGPIVYMLTDSSFELTSRFSSNTVASANNTAATAAFGIACLLIILKRKGITMLSLLLILSLLFVGLLTQSRSFLLACLVMVSIFTFLGGNIARAKGIFITIAIRLSFVVVLVGALYLLLTLTPLGDVFEYAINRVIHPRNDDITNNRWFLWIFYFEQWTSSILIFLMGLGANSINERLGVDYVAHNFLLEAAVSYGFIGLTLIIAMYLKIWRQFTVKNISKSWTVAMMPLIISIMTSFTGHGLMGMQFMFQFVVSIIALNYISQY